MAKWLLVKQASWVCLAISLYMTYEMGNMTWWAPGLGLLSQVFWGVLAYDRWKSQRDLGLAAMTLFYMVLHARNAWLWWR